MQNRFYVSSVGPHRLTAPKVAARFQGLRKYQYHLKSNACWPASGRGRLRRAQLLTRFKSSMEAEPSRERKAASGCKQGKFRQKLFVNEHCAFDAVRLRYPCRADRSSQIGAVFRGRLRGAFQFRQAPIADKWINAMFQKGRFETSQSSGVGLQRSKFPH